MKHIALIFLMLLAYGCAETDLHGDRTLRYGKDEAPATKWDSGTRLAGNLKSRTLNNRAAYIPPQCYTKTQDKQGQVHNPCYSCHTKARRPNFIHDDDIQESYAFAKYALKNHWTNLFQDRSARVAAISDSTILRYVRNDNYRDDQGGLALANKLRKVPAAWDYDGDGRWDGYVPDSYFNFDAEGFDRNPAGGYTGWRAFAYYPFPGTFWPSNGSTDDVLIRLPKAFRTNEAGEFDLAAYKVNLAIVEAVIGEKDIPIEPVDERRLGVDLDKSGSLGNTSRIAYDWAPLEGRFMSYVGKARRAQENGKVHLAAGLFPEGTEFLHSVRYIDVTRDGGIAMAPRMKELRYARKAYWLTYSDLHEMALGEIREKSAFPDRLRMVDGKLEDGLPNGQGWVYQGFIEDAGGELRPQTYEETFFCIGCHGGIGATTDGAFAFPRKVDHRQFRGGWYHWTQKDMAGLPEPKAEIPGRTVQYEYSYYLDHNRSGNEFRTNDEIEAKFFNADGSVKPGMLTALHGDVAVLLNPSRERALTLNKAYLTIVEDQSFVLGRDPTVRPVASVFHEVDADQPTGVERVITARHVGG